MYDELCTMYTLEVHTISFKADTPCRIVLDLSETKLDK